MGKFGVYLKNEREARKISLEEISRATKIRRTILEAIEDDRTQVLPPEVFLKGFLEAYARYIGLPPEEVLARYNAWKPRDMTDEPIFNDEKVVSRKHILIGAIVLIIIIIAFVVLSGGGPREDTGKATVTTNNSGQKVMPLSNRVQPPNLTPPAAEPTSPPHEGAVEEGVLSSQGHTLVIKASERTWIEITEGSSPPFDVTLYSGESYTRTSTHHFELLIGNAAGVTVTFDGRGLGALGEVGHVVKLTLPPEGGG